MPKHGEITVGVDIGTTSVKSVAVNDAGEVLARARVPHQLNSPFPGAFEHAIASSWQINVLESLAQVAAGREVSAINVSAMVPSLGALDREGRPVSPGLLYGDSRGSTDLNRPEDPGDAGESLAFLNWLAKNATGAEYFWPAQAVANHALCGVGAIDSITAMSAAPLFAGHRWDADKAVAAGAAVEALPAVLASGSAVGRVPNGRPAANAVVGSGTIDAFGEQLVAGADNDGDVLVICGATLITWAVMNSNRLNQDVTNDGLWLIPHTAQGNFLAGGPSNAGGIFVDRAHRWLGIDPAHAMDTEDFHDVPVWLPYIRGERAPLHNPLLRAQLRDLSINHNATHIRRAVYEASGFVVRHHLELAVKRGARPQRIVATGGGSRSNAWMQALADTTGLPVDVVQVSEGAALGSAFIARCAAGLESNMLEARRWSRIARRVIPNDLGLEAADRRYSKFLRYTAEAVADLKL